jgi:hypothetical protein
MRPFIALLLFPLAASACGAADPPLIPSWDLDVYPILRGSCGHCHGSAARLRPLAD